MTCHHRSRTTELTAAELDRLRKVYADRDVRIAAIVGRFHISADTVMAIAVREGWPLRRAQVATRGERQAIDAKEPA